MMKSSRLSVIMPVYNALTYTKKTLESLKKNTENDYELIIVDDGSNKETKDYLKTVACHLITNAKNLMVSKSWNIGIKAATGDYLCIINNDILFTPDWDEKLIKALNNNVWVASPYHTEGEITFCAPPKPNRLDILGCCFLFKNGLMDKIGYFPEEMKLWYGEKWLGDIIKEKYHRKTAQIKDSAVHHFISKSTVELWFHKKTPLAKIIASDCVQYNKIRAAWT